MGTGVVPLKSLHFRGLSGIATVIDRRVAKVVTTTCLSRHLIRKKHLLYAIQKAIIRSIYIVTSPEVFATLSKYHHTTTVLYKR